MPVTVYQCAHCGWVFTQLSGCEKHEQDCAWNPEVRACPTCVHFKIPGVNRKTFDCEGRGTRVQWEIECEQWRSK